MKKQYLTWANGVTAFSLALFFPGILVFIFRENIGISINWSPINVGGIGAGIVIICRLLDLFDGWIARATNQVSDFGKWFDPFVDKIQVYVTLIALWSVVNKWLFWLMLARDLTKTIVRSHGTCDIAARRSDKNKAVLQSVALLPLGIGLLFNNPSYILLGNCFLGMAMICGLIWLGKYSCQNPANGMTFLNFYCGIFATGLAIEGMFFLSIASIFLGAIADNLDGRIARYLGTSDDGFGILLDDYSDFMTFGIATGVLIASYSSWGKGGLIISGIFISAVAGRLIHFTINKDKTPRGFFAGIPSPAGAAIICASILIGWNPSVILGIAIFASILTLCFPIFWPHQSCFTANETKLTIVATFVVVVIFDSMAVAPAVLVATYILFPLWKKPTTT